MYESSEVLTFWAMVMGELGLDGSISWMVKLEGSVLTDYPGVVSHVPGRGLREVTHGPLDELRALGLPPGRVGRGGDLDGRSAEGKGEGEGGEEAESRDHDERGLWLVSMGGGMGCLGEWWWVLERV